MFTYGVIVRALPVLGIFWPGIALVVVLKWQPWLARLHQGGIGIAVVAAAWPPLGKRMRARLVVGEILVLLAAQWWPGREIEGRRLWSEPSLFFVSREANYFCLIGGAEERVAGLAHTVIESDARSILIPNVHGIADPLLESSTARISFLPRCRFGDGRPFLLMHL